MKNILLLILAGLCMQVGMAQTNFTASYPISMPAGKFSDYLSATSWRGINMEVTKKLHSMPALHLGIEGGWSLFYEQVDSKTYTEGTASLSGKQFRYTNTVPLLAEGKYFFNSGSGKPITFFAGLGVGTLYVDRYTDFGLYRITNDTWQFCLRPEAGIAFISPDKPSFTLGVKYYSGFNNADMDGQSYFSINIGIAMPGF